MTALLKETSLLNDHPISAMFLEFGRLKRVDLIDGTVVTAEVTKRQRGIYEKLGIVT